MYKVLLVEDSSEYVNMIHKLLGAKYQLHAAPTLAAARQFASNNTYDVILLDIMLPDGSGFDYCTELRTTYAADLPPIIFLSGLSEVQDKVMGWSLGADDYIVKPFPPLEFQARVQNRIDKHRQQTNIGTVLRWSSLTLDLAFHEAKIEDAGAERKLDLTPIEFKILHCLGKNPERVLSRAQLIEFAWGNDVHVTERTVDKHISTLRHKLTSSQIEIRTISGVGYSLVKSTILKKTGS